MHHQVLSTRWHQSNGPSSESHSDHFRVTFQSWKVFSTFRSFYINYFTDVAQKQRKRNQRLIKRIFLLPFLLPWSLSCSQTWIWTCLFKTTELPVMFSNQLRWLCVTELNCALSSVYLCRYAIWTKCLSTLYPLHIYVYFLLTPLHFLTQ